MSFVPKILAMYDCLVGKLTRIEWLPTLLVRLSLGWVFTRCILLLRNTWVPRRLASRRVAFRGARIGKSPLRASQEIYRSVMVRLRNPLYHALWLSSQPGR